MPDLKKARLDQELKHIAGYSDLNMLNNSNREQMLPQWTCSISAAIRNDFAGEIN